MGGDLEATRNIERASSGPRVSSILLLKPKGSPPKGPCSASGRRDEDMSLAVWAQCVQCR